MGITADGVNDATSQAGFAAAVGRLRRTFETGRTKSLGWRIGQLRQLRRFVKEHREELIAALWADLNKNRMEAILFEVDFVINAIDGALYDLDEWAAPEHVSKTLMTVLDSAYVLREPYGVTLIVGAWNYPIQLVICPLVGALAAGNCAVVKLPELCQRTASVLARLGDYLDADAFLVVVGGVTEAVQLLEERFDFIFFTGSTRVGRLVYAAAQRHLTPVALELGGKCPAYVDAAVDDFEVAVRRLLWGKFVNAGQTCVAPDYVMCQERVYDRFIDSARRAVREFFGDQPQDSPDFGRIISEQHAQRLEQLLVGADVAVGGDVCVKRRYVAPTIVQNVRVGDPLMLEEIFGPVLPVVRVADVEDAIHLVNAGDKPLCAYVFASSPSVVERFLAATSSGSVCVNDVMVHLSVEDLPFGGVGASGIGRYHGRHSFNCFSNAKAVLHRDYNATSELVSRLRYAPITEARINVYRFVLKRRGSLLTSRRLRACVPAVLWMLLGALLFRSLTGFRG